MPYLIEECADEAFYLTRPQVEWSFENVKNHLNSLFEIISVDPIRKHKGAGSTTGSATDSTTDADADMDADEASSKCMRLKGQMLFVEAWDCIMFLGTPIMDNLDVMFTMGLYINDFSMHDASRDMVLAGTQQAAELKMALESEYNKSKKLERSIVELDQETKRCTNFLYHKTPKLVSDPLKNNEPSKDHTATSEMCTVITCEILGLNDLVENCQDPVKMIKLINTVYMQFDELADKNQIYKLASESSKYIAVSGLPVPTENHAVYACDFALDMMAISKHIKKPDGEPVKLKMAIHSGSAMAVVLGTKAPRYSILGEAMVSSLNALANGSIKVWGEQAYITESVKKLVKELPFETRDAPSFQDMADGLVGGYWLEKRATDSNKSVWKTLEEEADLSGMQGGSGVLDAVEMELRTYFDPIEPEFINVDMLDLDG